jgi:hypothetical protein
VRSERDGEVVQRGSLALLGLSLVAVSYSRA